MKESFKGALFIILAMSIFAFYGIVIRLIDLPAFVIVFFMFLISAIVLFIYFLIKDRPVLNVKKYAWFLALLGFVNLLNNFFFFQAFKLTTISNAVLTHYTAPIFVAFLAPFLLKEKLQRITVIALILSLIGLFFIFSNDLSLGSQDFIGMMYGTGSGFMYAFVIILIKYLSDKISVYSITIFHSFAAALFISPFVFAAKISFNANSLLLLLVFAMIFGTIATLIYMAGVKRVKSQHAGILAYIEPFAATFYGFIFFTEIPTLFTIIGGILILYGGYLVIKKIK